MTPQRRLSMLINLRKSKILKRHDVFEIVKMNGFKRISTIIIIKFSI
jgi:hypothetical protein